MSACSRVRAVVGDICALSLWNWRPRLSAVLWLDSINAKQIVVTFVHSAYIIASVIISRYLTVFVQSSVGASIYSVSSCEYLLSFLYAHRGDASVGRAASSRPSVVLCLPSVVLPRDLLLPI